MQSRFALGKTLRTSVAIGGTGGTNALRSAIRHRNLGSWVSVGVALLALAVTAERNALADNGPTFSTASLVGNYRCKTTGFSFAGFNGGPPSSIFLDEGSLVAIVHFDGAGHITASADSNLAYTQAHPGQLCKVPSVGTYSVNPDGTGTQAVLVSPDPAAICGTPFSFSSKMVLEKGGSRFESVSITPGEVLSGICEKM